MLTSKFSGKRTSNPSSQEVLERLQPMFRDALDDPSITVTLASTDPKTKNVAWLEQVELVALVERSFGVHFYLGELEYLKDVRGLVDLILEKNYGSTPC